MRILLSSFQCWPNRGSELGHGWHWARALTDLGHDVTVLTQPKYRDVISEADGRGIDFQFIDAAPSPLTRFSRQLGLYHYYLRWQDAALRHVEAQPREYDVVHHVVWGSLHLGSMLWRLPAPLVYGPIGGGQTAPSNYWRYFGRHWPAEALRTVLTRYTLKLNSRSRNTLRNAAAVLVYNSDTEAAALRLGATDVRHMLAFGLRPDWIGEPRRQPSGPPVVLWVGRLLPRKAPTLAIQAFAQLRQTMPARLVMAGDGPLREDVRKAVMRSGFADDIQLLGQVSWTEVQRLSDSASAFLFSSLRDSFGAQVIEALARGLPVVCINHHGIGEQDYGLAAVKVDLPPDPRDLPRDLAAGLRTVLSDGKWDLRSAAGVEWAGRCFWPDKAAAATRVYEEIVERYRATRPVPAEELSRELENKS